MIIPYVIDNQTNRMADVINEILSGHPGKSFDIATAYFTVGGFGLLQDGLQNLGNFRLLLGFEPREGRDIGMRPDPDAIQGLIKKDIEILPFDEKSLRLVEDLIAYLRRDTVKIRNYSKGFLHAKCYLFYSDHPEQPDLFDRFRPIIGIVGSSNFTIPGLTTNKELNISHKVLLDQSEVEDFDAARAVRWLSDEKPSYQIKPVNRQLIKSEVGARAIIELERWYDKQWADSEDFKEELIRILDESKFGKVEYTPWQIYMKALYEYFKDDLGEEVSQITRSAIELTDFQEDAVKKARKILSRYDGVMVADSVGLGKTWIGKKLMEDFAYHMRQKALIVCPASLREMWQEELVDATIPATIISQESLGRDEFDPVPYGDCDVILIDESHNFRNPNSKRYGSLELILGQNRGRGRDGGRKKLILLTATPINNSLFDLYNQLSLITQGDKSYFSVCGIGDLRKYFLQARRDNRLGTGAVSLFNLLEEIVIRRTRPFIKKAYPEATIHGKKITFPERRLKTIRYDLEETYSGIYENIVSGISNLKLTPYNLEAYKKAGIEVDEMEFGREAALVGIFKSRYLKRFESSIEAFRISIQRAMAFHKTFESYILDGKVLKSSDFQKAMRYLEREDEEDDATPSSMAEDIDANEEAKSTLEAMEEVDPSLYDLRKLHESVQNDIEILTDIWYRVKDIKPENDAKLQRIKDLLQTDLKGKKVLLFTYYKDTARYVYKHIGDPKNPDAVKFKEKLGGVSIRRMDGGVSPKDRVKLVAAFAPKAHGKLELVGSEKEIDIMVSTDVLSEGQNLQDCGYLVNYDLHWNPTRMVQRAGRIDRIGTEFDTLWIHNMFPDEGLEKLLGLVESLMRKITDIDKAGFLDTSVLGETVHPQNFNTLRRIEDEDGTVIEEEEQFTELASNEFLQQQLRNLLDAGGKEMLASLPDGIHSGLARENAKGVFFYFQANPGTSEKLHFWRYYDLREERIVDNRYLISNYIQCEKDTPRVVEPEMFASIFDYQEKAVEDILRSFQQQKALEQAPRTVEPIQQTVATTLQGYINHPDIDRQQIIQAIKLLNEPMLRVRIKQLREAYNEFQNAEDVNEFLNVIGEVIGDSGPDPTTEGPDARVRSLKREDLRLICFDLVSGA